MGVKARDPWQEGSLQVDRRLMHSPLLDRSTGRRVLDVADQWDQRGTGQEGMNSAELIGDGRTLIVPYQVEFDCAFILELLEQA